MQRPEGERSNRPTAGRRPYRSAAGAESDAA